MQDTVLAAERNATRAAQKEAAARGKIADQEARMKVQALAKSDREIQRIKEGATRTAERAMANEVRAFERAEQEKNRIASQWVAKREREEASSLARANATRQRFASAVAGKAVSGFATGAGRIAGIAGQVGGAVANLAGGFSVADSVQRGVSLRHDAAVLSASTELAGPGAKKISTDTLVNKARSIGAEQNIDPAEVLKGFDEVKKLTGDLDKAMQVMPGIAKLATATGGKLSEMSGLAANILAANPDISNKDLDAQMRVFTRQGVVGGVEVADFAKYGSRLTAGASLFGGDSSKNQASLGAVAQIARQFGGAATPAEATLAAQRFATDTAKHASSLKAKGINVSDGHGNLRDVQSILADMVDKTGGDVTKLGSMGLGERGVKALTGVSAIYKRAGEGEKGKEAVKAEFAKYTSGVSKGEVDAASSRVLGETDAKMDLIRQKFDEAVSTKIIPALLKLVPEFEKMVPLLVDLNAKAIPAFVDLLKSVADFADANKGIVSTIASHPFAAIIGASLAKSAGSEIISKMAGSALSGLLGRLGGGGGAGGPGGGGVAGALAAGALAGAATYAVAKPSIDAALSGQSSGQAEAGSLTSSLKRGSASEKAAALAAYDAMEKRSGGGKGAARVLENAMGHSGFDAIYSAVTGEKNKSSDLTKQAVKDSEVLGNKELQSLVAALRANTAATVASTGGGAAVRNPSTPITQRPNQ